MLIGIDGNEANVDNRVGVGQYAYNLLLNLYKLDKKNKYIIYLKEEPNSDLPKEKANWQYKIIKPKKLWSRFALPLHFLIFGKKLDLFFSPNHYSPLFCPCPIIPTIHDLGYLKFKKQFTRKDLHQLVNWTKQSLKKAAHIIAVSNFSKNELIKTYQIDPNKINIAYNGVSSPPKLTSKQEKAVLKKFKLKENNYLLYLGTLKPNKNIPFLIKSFSLFYKKELIKSNYQKNFKLVIAGKKGWLFKEIFSTVKKEKMIDHIVFTDYINDTQKWSLYKNAIATLLPSTYEGFGIPAIESMKIGTPVIASNIPPLKEILEDTAIFIDPHNQEDFCHKMTRITNPKTRQEYSQLGRKQANKFTWQNTAKSVLKTFQKFNS